MYPHRATDGCELQTKIYVSAAVSRTMRTDFTILPTGVKVRY